MEILAILQNIKKILFIKSIRHIISSLNNFLNSWIIRKNSHLAKMFEKNLFLNQIGIWIFQVKPNLLNYLISSRFIFLRFIFINTLKRFFIQQIFESVIKLWGLFLEFIVVRMRFQKLLNVSNHFFFKVLTALILSYFQMIGLNWIVKTNLHDLITLIK